MVTGHCNGMYTYVHPNEIRHLPYGDLAVGVYGRSKRHRDSKELLILNVNRSADQ